jgi:hypothetical protein
MRYEKMWYQWSLGNILFLIVIHRFPIVKAAMNAPLICKMLNGVNHRVGRVLSLSPVVGIGTPPTPKALTRRQVCPPFGSGGRGTVAGERGGGRVPIPTREHTVHST